LDNDFRQEVKALSKPKRRIIGHAIADIQEAFGNPHFHSGIGVRKLGSRCFVETLLTGRHEIHEEGR
jgi:hypothetical protein